MKGTPKNSPTNYVEWANGFKSNMPDWTTARHCALSDKMLWHLKECRTVLLALQQPGTNLAQLDPYLKDKWGFALDSVMELIAEADGLSAVVEALKPIGFPQPPGFPKPPGVK